MKLSNNIKKKLIKSLEQLYTWLQDNEYKGYEPFDGLLSFLRPLAFRNVLAERCLEQSVLRCPFHIRPLLGIEPRTSAQAMGYLSRGYLRMWVLTKDIEYKDKAGQKVSELIEIKPHDQAYLKEGMNEKQKQTLAVNHAKWEAAQAWCRMQKIGFRIVTEKDMFHQGSKKRQYPKQITLSVLLGM